MGKSNFGFRRLGGFRGLCIKCKAPFVGKGDRCPNCADELRVRRRRRP